MHLTRHKAVVMWSCAPACVAVVQRRKRAAAQACTTAQCTRREMRGKTRSRSARGAARAHLIACDKRRASVSGVLRNGAAWDWKAGHGQSMAEALTRSNPRRGCALQHVLQCCNSIARVAMLQQHCNTCAMQGRAQRAIVRGTARGHAGRAGSGGWARACASCTATSIDRARDRPSARPETDARRTSCG